MTITRLDQTPIPIINSRNSIQSVLHCLLSVLQNRRTRDLRSKRRHPKNTDRRWQIERNIYSKIRSILTTNRSQGQHRPVLFTLAAVNEPLLALPCLRPLIVLSLKWRVVAISTVGWYCIVRGRLPLIRATRREGVTWGSCVSLLWRHLFRLSLAIME